MEEIKVGEYVRISSNFRLIALGIGKVIKINQDTIYVKMNFEMPFSFKIENITKHSKNIIDLIKVGDIVHIKDVLHEDIAYIWSEDYLKALKEDLSNGIKLVEILTHEQFEQNSYKV